MDFLTTYRQSARRIERLTSLLVLTGATFCGVAILSGALHRSIGNTNAVRLEITKLEEGQKVKVLDRGSLEQFSKDFAAGLPLSNDVQHVLDEIRRSSDGADVVVTSVEAQRHVRARDQLPRSDFTVSLRGSYSNLKRVVSEVLDRFPHATATRVAIRRGSQSASADATFALALWARAEAPAGSSPDLSLPKATR